MVREESVVDQHCSSSVAKSMVSTMLDDLPKTTGSQTSRQRDEPRPEKVIHKYGFEITVYPCAKEESVAEELGTAYEPAPLVVEEPTTGEEAKPDGKGDGDVSVDHFDEKIVESAAAARRTLSQRRGRARAPPRQHCNGAGPWP